MITLYYTHDRDADELTIEIYSGASKHAAVVMSKVTGDREHFWTGTVSAPPTSRVYYRVLETIGDGAPLPAADGDERGFSDNATIEIGASSAGIDAILEHGDTEWSGEGGSGGTTDASEVAQYLATYLASSRRISFDGPAIQGQHLQPPLVQGASYREANGRALRFTATSSATIPNGTTAVLRAIGHNPTPRAFQLTGTVLERTDATKIVQFEATSQQSAAWQPGTYQFQIDLVFPGSPVQTAPFIGPGFTLSVVPAVPAVT